MENDEADTLAWSLMDIMAATMFVFVLLLVLYIYLFRANYEDAPAVGPYMSDLVARRSMVLDMLSNEFSKRGIKHALDIEQAEIAIDASELLFASGRYELDSSSTRNVERISDALFDTLKCFAAAGTRPSNRCPKGVDGSVRALEVVGHTDNTPVRAGSIAQDNLDLSARRAAHLVRSLERNSNLTQLRNRDHQSLLLVVGAGARRPAKAHTGPVADERNRRITIRVALEAPWVVVR